MPLYLGSKTVSENINMGDTVIQNTFDLFDVKWSDHVINNESWMCADDFNWIDGSVFSAAWNELKSEWDLATVDSTPAQQETIGDITINYWKSPKGYKLVEYGGDTPETNENLLQQLYDEVGIAWYYLIDTTGQIRFKLPRTKYGFVGVRSGAGNFVDESLPNIKGYSGNPVGPNFTFTAPFVSKSVIGTVGLYPQENKAGLQEYIDLSTSNSTYQDGANVQQKSTEMHLYFYLADFVRTPLESNLNTFITETKEALNEKVNISDYSADKTTIENDINTLETTVNTQLTTKQDKLTTEQLSAVNSGITSAKVSTYDEYAEQISARQLTSNLSQTVNESTTLYPSNKAVQNAVGGKQNTITGAATSITSTNLTANRALVSDGSGKVAVSPITDIELNYLNGVTSNVQTQLNARAKTDLSNIASNIAYITEKYANGKSGYVVFSNGFCEQWGEVNIPGNQITTVQLLKNFKDVNYCITNNKKLLSVEFTDGWGAGDFTVSSFKFANGHGSTVTYNWHAVGFVS